MVKSELLLQAEMIIEEFMMMGMPKRDLLKIFNDPFYQGTYTLTRRLGEETIANLIDAEEELRHG